MLHTHLLLVLLVVILFVVRVLAAEYRPELLDNKALKIAPHALAALLILTGIGLVFSGNWLAGDYGWIVAKLVLLVGFIGLGILAIKQQGEKRWYAFAGALFVVAYIVKIAISKQIFF